LNQSPSPSVVRTLPVKPESGGTFKLFVLLLLVLVLIVAISTH
jgi:hypothetical protein